MSYEIKRIFSGIQPSGSLTLGNYLGAIKHWVSLQHDNACLFCVVDLHAITIPQSPLLLAQLTREVAAILIASGIDPQKNPLFVQSHVSSHSELAWILSCFTPLGWLNRMTQFKEKSGKHREQACLGLYAYPVLMAADVLAYKATHIPVGEDQKQHLELARDIAGSFNRYFKQDFFPLPEPLILGPAPRVMSLRDGTKKMSKSDPSDFSRIHLMDDPDTISLKIRKAKTDPDPLPLEMKDLENRVEAKNLVTIYAALACKDPSHVLMEFSGASFSTFKAALTDLIVSVCDPIRQEALKILKDPHTLDRSLKEGSDRALAISQKNLEETHKLIGFLKKLS
jgi:tryptophanyl-tRNA synthetase